MADLRNMLMGGPVDAYRDDQELMRSLGLRTEGYEHGEWTDLGTVTMREADPEHEYGPRPATTVRVEVMVMPAMFWRFTVVRPRDAAEVINGEVVAIYEPLEVYGLSTGSGLFSEYWPTVKLVADHMLTLVQG